MRAGTGGSSFLVVDQPGKPAVAKLLANDLRQALRVVGPDADNLPAQRQFHAGEAPQVVGPAAAREAMNAPAVEDRGAADLDAVPWNNNLAENAVKLIASRRKRIDGLMSEEGIKFYLIFLSIYQNPCRPRSGRWSRGYFLGTTAGRAWIGRWPGFRQRPGSSCPVGRTTNTPQLATFTAFLVSGMPMRPTISAAFLIGTCKNRWGTLHLRLRNGTSSTRKFTRNASTMCSCPSR